MAVSLYTAIILLFNLTRIQTFFLPSLPSVYLSSFLQFLLLNFSSLLLLSFLLTFLPYLFLRSFHFFCPFHLFLLFFDFSWFLFLSFFLSSIPYPMVVFRQNTCRVKYSETSNTVNLLVNSSRGQGMTMKKCTQYPRSEFEPVTTKSKRPRRSWVPEDDSWSIQLFQLFFVYMN